MKPLDEYVAQLRADKGAEVPDFSTEDGGTEARVLYLLQDPGNSGASRSGVVKRDNEGLTAKNFREANEGLDQRLAITWNAVPWPVPECSTPAKELRVARDEGRLDELLKLLEERLRVVVLLGGVAQRLTPDLYDRHRHLHVLHGPHPSWRGVSTPERKRWLRNTVLKGYELIERQER